MQMAAIEHLKAMLTNVQCCFLNALVGWFMVFNATLNNILTISRRSVLLVEETGVSRENH